MDKLDKLKDIKDIVRLDIDYLPYILILFFIIVAIIFIYLFFLYQKNKKLTQKEKIKKMLKKYDFNKEAKTIAYDFTIYAKEVISEKDFDEYNKIVKELERFKYKKNVDKKLPNDLIDEIKEFIRVRV